MTPRTYRRKLQKKLKHKPYVRCPRCGGRMDGRLDGTVADHGKAATEFTLVYICNRVRQEGADQVRCRHRMVKGWTGGGTADAYPTG